MGSTSGNQNPWAPYSNYKDCSQGICSVYCPQWCYIIFPPPPPFNLGDDDSNTDFSPLIIAVIGILASAFILVTYYTLISKYCKRRGHGDGAIELNENQDQMPNEAWQGVPAGGLDEALIKSITICKYKKGDGFVEGTDCSVCLSEFQENESLRLLPKCSHAFHLPCIDTWLKSHASCPLCRANIAPTNILPSQMPAPAVPVQENQPSNTNEYQHRTNDAVLVIQDLEGSVRQGGVVSLVIGGDTPKTPVNQDLESRQNAMELESNLIQPIRRSVSLNFSLSQNQISISDILGISEDDDEDSDDYQKNGGGGILNLVSSPFGMKRSISTGRFMFTRYEKGRSSMIPS
ncbi:unnamed protein product [Dovyalis caffra]|uniref:RING-type E3 ubiquitin transferase n=1 Tax=Dovyalis caffra TaxID=77055 RepID=A0AAV1S259_9ROSI|nr:unnamed protein product [Dovyalis caffra]